MKNNRSQIEERVMSSIESGEVKMRPRWIFITAAAFAALAAGLAVFVSAYFINLTLYLSRVGLSDRPMYGARRNAAELVSAFPWWALVAAAVALAIALWVFRRSGRVYRVRISVLLLSLLLLSLVAGLIMNLSGMNSQLQKNKQFRGLYGGRMHDSAGYFGKNEIKVQPRVY